MAGAVESARERDGGDRRRLVAPLEKLGQTVLPHAFDLARGKRRVHENVGEDRKGFVEPLDRNVERDGGGVPARFRREVRAEEVGLVGDLERPPRSGAFVQHVGGQARQARLLERVVSRSRADDRVDLHDRHFVTLDHEDRQAVRKAELQDGRELQGPHGPESRRFRTIGFRAIRLSGSRFLPGRRQREDQEGQCDRGESPSHGFFSAASAFFPCGTTERTSRASSRR